MARQLSSSLPAGVVTRSRKRRWTRLRLVLLFAGVACIVAGAALIAGPLYSVWQRGNFDQNSVNNWTQGGSSNLAGPPKSGGAPGSTLACGSGSSSDYALLQFTDPKQYGYAGVAGDGDWSLLDTRSMVHYHGSADPGQQGNVIVAFHREPTYQHINELGKGGIVTVQDRACHTFRYQVTEVWTGPPGKVNQLVPTTGHDLTLITCTPWWVDSERMVWRASLIA